MLANAIYLIALTLASPVVLYRMIRHGRYRRGVGEKLLGLSKRRGKQLRSGNGECLWIHAVSVGEVNLLPGVVKQIRTQDPDVAIAVSTSTDTGYDVAVKHFGEEAVFFCPLDFTWAVRRTLQHLSPSRLVLAELELWPNLIRAAATLPIPVLVMNARLSEKSGRGYQKFGRLTRGTFARLSWVGCQDQTCADRFAACGTPTQNISVTGSLKFDDAPTSRETAAVQARQQWAGVDPWHRVWMFGSTQSGEEKLGLQVYQTLAKEYPELRLILVPRHPERFDDVAAIIQAAGLKVHRRSRDDSLYNDEWTADTVILIDTIGELRHWWGVCQIATVGGSFGNRGGQNMLEPAGYGSAVSFGPNTKNFSQIANRLIDAGGAIRVASEPELGSFVQRCLTDVSAADGLGRSARKVIQQHRGATERTVSQLLATKNASSRRAAA